MSKELPPTMGGQDAVYDWFTEGLDTADLQEAKELLEELGSGRTGGNSPQAALEKLGFDTC